MRTRYRQTEQTGAAIALRLLLCMSACGLFGLCFFALFEPRHIANPGLAAYKPFPGTVIKHPATTTIA
jgi:hypothetical protein